MNHSRFLLFTALALAGLALPLRADANHIGTQFPPIELEGLSQTKAKTFDDFAGRTVLVVFFAYWGAFSGEEVPHLNDLHAQFEARGLSVVGATIDRKDKTEPWIVAKGVKYAYGYDHGGKYQNQLGITMIPQALLVDPSGKVVWEGQPSKLEPSVIEKALAGAFTKPVWEWPASAKLVRAALAKHKYGEALAEARKLGDADMGPAIQAEIQGLIVARMQSLKALFDAGDFLGATESADALAKDLDGLPEAAEVKKTQDAIKANKDSDRILRGQKSVGEIRNGKLTTKKELDEAMSKLDKLAKANPGTIIETEAKALMNELESRHSPGK